MGLTSASTLTDRVIMIPPNHVIKNSTKVVLVWKYLARAISTRIMIRADKLGVHSPDGEEQHPRIPLRLVSLKPETASENAYQRKCMVARVLELFPEPGGVSLPMEEASGHPIAYYRDSTHRQGII